MPSRPPSPCPVHGCGVLTREGRCPAHQQQKRQDAERLRATRTERGYSNVWYRASVGFLRSHPLCVRCQEQGRYTAATVTDHIVPHKGDMVLFWDKANWQPLCKPCHDTKTATEDGGFGRPSVAR